MQFVSPLSLPSRSVFIARTLALSHLGSLSGDFCFPHNTLYICSLGIVQCLEVVSLPFCSSVLKAS